jgi:phosphoribosylglycinamide formyltransferase 1
MQKIAIFASGSGTNAQQLMEHFNEHAQVQVACMLSNKSDAPVLLRAANFMVPTYTFDRHTFYETTETLDFLRQKEIDWLVLAGFLWLIPAYLLEAFPNKIINLHPALLPKFGGKGMYGMKVHEAVLAAGEKTSGITIHFASEAYDEGKIIFQTTCDISPDETPESLARKIHKLEHTHLPEIVENVIRLSFDVFH